MSTYSNPARSAARDAISALLTSGTTVTYPTMRFRASTTVLLSVDLNATTPINAASDGVAAVNDPVSGGGAWATFSQTPTAAGTCDNVVFCDRDEVIVETASVGATGSGEEVEVNNVNFVTTAAVTTTTAPTLTQRASYDPTP